MSNEWLPIETAPRDGTTIVVWPPTWAGTTSCAYWNSDEYARSPRPYWRRFDAFSVTASRQKSPTHWRPVLVGPTK